MVSKLAVTKWRYKELDYSSIPSASLSVFISGGASREREPFCTRSTRDSFDTFYRSHARFMTSRSTSHDIIVFKINHFAIHIFRKWSSWKDSWANRNVTKFFICAKNKLFFIFHSAFFIIIYPSRSNSHWGELKLLSCSSHKHFILNLHYGSLAPRVAEIFRIFSLKCLLCK